MKVMRIPSQGIGHSPISPLAELTHSGIASSEDLTFSKGLEIARLVDLKPEAKDEAAAG